MKPYPFGNYFLLERLAIGGMAEVYLAKSSGMSGFEELVALKRILPTIAADDEFVAMFIDEAKIAGQLSHGNVARIFDLGKIDSSYFIAMEYISGHDLRTLWDRVCSEGYMPIALACYVTQKICAGLDYAHRKRDSRGRALGIIHRDVSPQNVLMSYTGDIKVIDFGIAKAANRMVRTATGILKGKFAYMAPEQAKGDPTDHRADIFAIGVMFYELLTGERAFKADTDYALLKKVREVNLVPPRDIRPDIPRQLEDIIYKAMAKNATGRYAWASALASDLDRFMSEQGLTYNKEELSAYLRRYFRPEYEEEQRRLAEYSKFTVSFEESVSASEDADESYLPHGPESHEIHDVGTQLEEVPSDSFDSVGSIQDESEFDSVLDESQISEMDSSEDISRGIGDASLEGVSFLGAAETQLIAFQSSALSSDDDALETKYQRGKRISPWDEPETQFSEEDAPSRREETRLFSDEHEDETMLDDLPPMLNDEHDDSDEIDEHEVSISERATNEIPPAPYQSQESLHEDEDDLDESLETLVGEQRAQEIFESAFSDMPESITDAAPSTSALKSEYNPFEESGGEQDRGPFSKRLGIGLLMSVILIALIGFTISLSGSTEVTLTSEIDGVRVMKGSAEVCSELPCSVEIVEDKEEFLFLAPGHEPLSKNIGSDQDVVQVRLFESSKKIKITTEPEGATVRVNGKVLKKTTPVTVEDIAVNVPHKIEVELFGFELLERTEVFEASSAGLVHFELESSRTKWSIATKPKDALIEFADGSVKERKATRRVEKGEVEAVRVVRPGCQPKMLALTGNGRPAMTKKVSLVCKPLRGRLSILSRTPVKTIINGIEQTRSRWIKKYPLPAGEHTLTIIGRSGKRETKVIKIRSGKTLKVRTKVR